MGWACPVEHGSKDDERVDWASGFGRAVSCLFSSRSTVYPFHGTLQLATRRSPGRHWVGLGRSYTLT